MDTVDSIDAAIFYSSIGAAVFGLSLIACQTDMISRRILSPLRLYGKVRVSGILMIFLSKRFLISVHLEATRAAA